jgi:hypothetical protein
MKYTADIGTWEEFQEVDVEASTPHQAFRKLAVAYGAAKIVQIFQPYKNGAGKKCVYDYMNGFALYNRESPFAQLPDTCPECNVESKICPECGYKLYCPECGICGGCMHQAEKGMTK